MERSTYRNLLKTVLFTLLVIIMLLGILHVVNYKSTGGGGGFQRFYQKKSNSIDVMFFGSSHAHCTIDHGYLWDEYGMAGYTLSAGGQRLDSTYYFIKEALRTQTPRVIVVEMLGATGNEIQNTDTDVYRNALSMRWSDNSVEYMNYLADSMQMDKTGREELFTKIPIVHSRYRELEQSDFVDRIPFMVGYRGSYERAPIERPDVAGDKEILSLTEEKIPILQNIIDEAKAKGVEVVFFASPFRLSQEQQEQFNAVEEFAAAQNIPFINYNKLYDEIDLDFERDFRDSEHVNNYGAVKVTRHLAEFLKENYEIPDRRGEADYQLWEDNALYLSNKVLRHELEETTDVNTYLEYLAGNGKEKTILVALTGNYNALGEVYLEKLLQLGVTAEEYAAGGVFLFRGGEREAFLPGKEYNRCFTTPGGEIHVESSVTTTEDGEETQKLKLLINGQDYVMVENGVNIIVYEESIDQVIDAAGDDVYLGLELAHKEIIED